MAVAADALRIDGLREFQASLRRFDSKLPRELRVMLNAAAKPVVDDARRRAPGRAGASIRAASQQRAAVIKAGGARVPFYGFLDFGNVVHSGHGVGRGDSHPRPFIKSGRYLYPAFKDNKREVHEAIQDGIVGLARSVGWTVT